MSDTIKSLLENEKQLCISAINIILKISNNILNDPKKSKYRSINLKSEIVEKILFNAAGALEILFLMGFVEGVNELVLPDDASLDTMTKYRDQLEKLKRENMLYATEENLMKKPKSKNKFSDAELSVLLSNESQLNNQLQDQFQQVLLFERSNLQNAAKKVMPHKTLAENARKREKAIREDQAGKNPAIGYEECLLAELLKWFKEEFFSWFDSGVCDACSKPMAPKGYVPPNEGEKSYGASRVEQYACESCANTCRFPRYFHPGKLLETRKGRCMEWASCFALCCRSLGLDTRYVWDKTDHVWVEVFSTAQNRWIHADPCENKLDCPLMYERGWKKKLSYIFAFSKDEVLDCTWRYSSNRKDVCTRRSGVRENVLAAMLHRMNVERSKSFPEPKRNFLQTRLVNEISEFFAPPQSNNDGENEGRSSGSLAWRLTRGEAHEQSTNSKKFVFSVTDAELAKKEMVVKYCCSKDAYVREVGEASVDAGGNGWQSRVFESRNVFRKLENDWKMVYLARTEHSAEGEIKWKFEWPNKSVSLKKILVVFQHKTYENGQVQWQVCCGDSCFNGNKNGVLEISSGLNGTESHVEVSALLSKGKGDSAWQHAQLFRQSDADQCFPFMVRITFA